MENDDVLDEQEALDSLADEFQRAVPAGLGSTLGNLGNYDRLCSTGGGEGVDVDEEEEEEEKVAVRQEDDGEQCSIETEIANEVHLTSSADTARRERCLKMGAPELAVRLKPPLNTDEDEEGIIRVLLAAIHPSCCFLITALDGATIISIVRCVRADCQIWAVSRCRGGGGDADGGRNGIRALRCMPCVGPGRPRAAATADRIGARSRAGVGAGTGADDRGQ